MALLDRGEQVVGIDNLNDYYDPALKRARLERLRRRMAMLHLRAGRFRRPGSAGSVRRATPLRPDRPSRRAGRCRYSLVNPQAYVRSNLMGQINMLELARLAGRAFRLCQLLVGLWRQQELPFRVEDRVDHPISLYAATKKADELMSESYAHLFRMPMTGLRFFTVYGPWGRPDMAMWIFTKALFEGRPLKVFNGGEMRRDFTYIDDIVRGVLACIDGRPPTMAGRKPAEATARMPSTISATIGRKS